MASRSILELIIRQKKEGRGVKDTEKEVKGLGKTIKGLGVGFAAAGGAALAAGAIMKKAFDLGREGAVVLQTAESFDILLEKVGAVPSLLDDLRSAASGTVDDMQLMSSTATLLAGASGDLAPALAAATPELLNIAKAANKLNPALGTTTFLYQSIATGVKRAQPLILDNLGLTIKVGEANQRMADQLGKSVEQLTAEEKSMAILNDTLRAGSILIDQVGGNTDSATDTFDRLTTALKNSSNQFKVMLFQGVAPFLEKSLDTNDAVIALREALDDGLISGKEFGRQMALMKTGQIEAADAMALVNERTEEQTEKTERADQAMRVWQDEMNRGSEAGEKLSGALEGVGEAAGGLSPLAQQFANARESIDLARQASDSLWDSMNVGIGSSIDRLQEQIDFMQAGGLNVQAAFENVKSSLEAGLIAPEEAETALRDIELAAIAVSTETGKIDMNDAIKQVRDEWNVSWGEAKKLIDNAKRAIDIIPDVTEKRIEFFIEYTGASLQGPGGAHGLDMVVPPGFPNDSFPIRATSGERVSITPAGQTSNIDQSRSLLSGANVNINNTLDERSFDSLIREWLQV